MSATMADSISCEGSDLSGPDFDDILAEDLRQLSVNDDENEDSGASQSIQQVINPSAARTNPSKPISTTAKLKTNLYKAYKALKVPTPDTSPPSTPTPNADTTNNNSGNHSPLPTPLLPTKFGRRQSTSGASKKSKLLYTDLASLDGSSAKCTDLPKVFKLKYLGKRSIEALWGARYTHKVVDAVLAKRRSSNRRSSTVLITVSQDGITIQNGSASLENREDGTLHFPIDMVSYGAQDFVYTKVFALITLCPATDSDMGDQGPFTCFVFYCDTLDQVEDMAAALAESFKRFIRKLEQPEPSPSVSLTALDDNHSEV